MDGCTNSLFCKIQSVHWDLVWISKEIIYDTYMFSLLLYFLYKKGKIISKAFCDSAISFTHNALVVYVQNWNIKIHEEQ